MSKPESSSDNGEKAAVDGVDAAATAADQAVDESRAPESDQVAQSAAGETGSAQNEDSVEFDVAAANAREQAAATATPDDGGAGVDDNAVGIDLGDDAESDRPDGGETAIVAAAATDGATPQGGEETPAEEAGDTETTARTAPPDGARPRRRFAWFALLNFLLILLLIAAAAYYWQQQRQAAAAAHAEVEALRDDIARRVETGRLEASLQALRGEIGGLGTRLGQLDGGQQELRESTVRLFDLYGRDKNDWMLAEVEYLMRVAQHQLVLTHDFEGAAITLQAANDKLGELADPGLLPVRVMIGEEIAALKTRKRPDLVGMTLILAQLARQVNVLKPGFEPLLEPAAPGAETPLADPPAAGLDDWMQRFGRFVDSLVEVRYEPDLPPTLAEAGALDAGETLIDTLKLARWSVLERDARQYQRLVAEAIRLTRSFYDLDNAANIDFLNQLTELQKMQLNPDKPDITGSLRELQRIVSERKNAPAPEAGEPAAEEPADG